MIQIDMEMPKTCDDCPFHIYHSGNNYVCVATPLFYPMNLANYKDGRKDFCPLIEVAQEPILDKIRAEILEDCGYSKDYVGAFTYSTIKVATVLQILDKYKAETEVEDGNDD